MSGHKHTPGPWEQGYQDTQTIYADARRIAVIQCSEKNWEANARLIAAAPELLAALKGLRHACQHMIGSFDADDIAAFEAASAAIAKATGTP